MKTFEMKLRGFGMFSLVAMSALPLFFASCSSDNDPVETESMENELTEIQLSGVEISSLIDNWSGNAPATRATSSAINLTSGSTVNVTVNNTSSKVQMYQQTLTAGTNGALSGKAKMYFPADGNGVDVYAYNGVKTIPTVDSKTPVKANTELSIENEADQSTTDNYTKSDFIFGQKLAQSRENSNITVELKHLLSRIKLTVAGSDQVGDLNLKLTKITLDAVKYKGTYTVGTTVGDVSVSDETSPIILYNKSDGIVINDELTLSDIKAVVMPQTLAAATKITFSTYDTNNKKEGKDFTFSIPADTKFEAGKSYNYKVTVATKGITVIGTIVDWVNGFTNGDTEIDAEYNFGN
jgi:endonuclease G